MKPDILVVDDDRDIVEAIKTMLTLSGYSARAAYSGSDCLKQMIEKRPSLLLLDLMLPDMDGKQVAKKIREYDNLRSTPIILISAAKEAKAAAKAIGVAAFIEKPFNLHDLLQAIDKYQLPS